MTAGEAATEGAITATGGRVGICGGGSEMPTTVAVAVAVAAGGIALDDGEGGTDDGVEEGDGSGVIVAELDAATAMAAAAGDEEGWGAVSERIIRSCSSAQRWHTASSRIDTGGTNDDDALNAPSGTAPDSMPIGKPRAKGRAGAGCVRTASPSPRPNRGCGTALAQGVPMTRSSSAAWHSGV